MFTKDISLGNIIFVLTVFHTVNNIDELEILSLKSLHFKIEAGHIEIDIQSINLSSHSLWRINCGIEIQNVRQNDL